jgi:DNA primase
VKTTNKRSKKEEKIDRNLLTRVKAIRLLRSPRFFQHFLDAIRRVGLVGEKQNALIIFVFGISRLLSHPLNVFVKGPSSSGKNHLVKSGLRFFPKDCVVEITSGSGASWNYLQNDLAHKIVYLQEENASAGNVHPARLLISENQLIRMVSVRVSGKGWVTERHVTKGPVACISTTTKDQLKVDDETRHLSVWTDDSPEQTKRILKAQFNKKEDLTDDELKVWHTMQTFLAKRAKLPIEFKGWVKQVVEDVWTGDVVVRRYFPAFMEACKVVCLLRSFRRDEDLVEKEGRLEISFSDYAITSLILNSALSQSISYVDDQDRELQKAVARIVDRKKGVGCDGEELAREMKISTDTAYKLLREARERGSVRRANKATKANVKLYEPADSTQMLPDPAEVYRKLGSDKRVLRIIHPVTGDEIVYRRNNS